MILNYYYYTNWNLKGLRYTLLVIHTWYSITANPRDGTVNLRSQQYVIPNVGFPAEFARTIIFKNAVACVHDLPQSINTYMTISRIHKPGTFPIVAKNFNTLKAVDVWSAHFCVAIVVIILVVIVCLSCLSLAACHLSLRVLFGFLNSPWYCSVLTLGVALQMARSMHAYPPAYNEDCEHGSWCCVFAFP